MSAENPATKSGGGILGTIEKIGNKVPHPVMMFLYLIIGVIVLSAILALLGVSVTEEVAVPVPGQSIVNLYEDSAVPGYINPTQPYDEQFEVKTETIPIQSLLTTEGIRFIFTSFVPNFSGFAVIGITFIALLGAGVAEEAGLLNALIRKLVKVAPADCLDKQPLAQQTLEMIKRQSKEMCHCHLDRVGVKYDCDDIFWLVSGEMYKITGGYDTEFAFQGEDFDWQVRAKLAGFRIIYTPYAKIWHKESMTIGKTSAFKAYYDARNPLIIHMKYRSPEQFKKVLRKRLTITLKATPKQFVKLRWKHLFKNWQGISSALLWGIRNKKLTLEHLI